MVDKSIICADEMTFIVHRMEMDYNGKLLVVTDEGREFKVHGSSIKEIKYFAGNMMSLVVKADERIYWQ